MFKVQQKLLIMCVFLVFSFNANAALIKVDPTSQNAEIGDMVSVDIIVADLGGVGVGDFDFSLSYDDALISLVSHTFGTELGDGLFTSWQGSDDTVSGAFSAFELSLESAPDLLASQPADSFTLVSLTFEALANGVADIDFTPLSAFDFFVLGNAEGIDIADGSMDGRIIIGQQVPEPGTLLLLLSGLLLVVRRKNGLKRA